MYVIRKGILLNASFDDDDNSYLMFSNNKERVDSSFILDEDGDYVKSFRLSDNDISDYYDISLWVKYKVYYGNESCKEEWMILDRLDSILGDNVKLHFNGTIDGWTVEDKSACSKYVPIKNLQGAYLVKKYEKKNGVTGEFEEREDIPVEKLVDTYRMYYCLE